MQSTVRQIKASNSTGRFQKSHSYSGGGTKDRAEWNAFVSERYAVVDYVD